MKQKIILHIGHGKTGSSAIQTVLARNNDILSALGVLYPDHPSLHEARQGLITSGNLDKEDWFEGQVMKIARANPTHPTILFSNEHLFNRFDELFDGVGPYREVYDFEIILFVRDPLELLASSYQQAIKRSGFFGGIGMFAPHVDHTIRAAALVERIERLGIGFKLFNYSKTRGDSVECFLTHLALWDDIKRHGEWETGTVNRSLTRAELRFVRDINRVFGAQYGTLISDALVNQLPDIPADPSPIDGRTAQEVRARDQAAIDNLNYHLPVDQRLSFDREPPAGLETEDETLSAEQAEVIRRIFPGALIHADGPILRDIAMKYETSEALTKRDAITLMEYAHKARPHGQIIAGKLKQWREQE